LLKKYQKLEDNTTSIVKQFEKGADVKVLITTHHKPDADALGSSLGLWHFLKNRGIDARVVTPTDYPHFLLWMPGEDEVINFEAKKEEGAELVNWADYIFCLDFNHLNRINEFGLLVGESKAKKIMIDHHRDPQGFDDFRLWTIETSSTCELIYNFIENCNGLSEISKETASCLYAGIMTDTGSFRFPSTSSKTHRIIADLMDCGAVNFQIHEAITDNYTFRRFRLMGFVLHKKLIILKEYNTALIALSREDLEQFNVQSGDTEGFVNFGLSIKGIKLSALIIDRTKLIKMSFRSKGDFPCNELAGEYFHGGGHLNASGGGSSDTLEQVVNTFRYVALPKYRDLLQK
jgi:bifunctional oligoribonuclease and PAP phosphatase NrnA